jgi:hypothetical protein
VRALRPSIDTKFHIDFSWWEKQNKDIRVFMRELLCPESQEAAATAPDKQMVDMVDPETAEVTQVDALWEAIRACCSLKPGYIAEDTPILDSIFRVFIANLYRSANCMSIWTKSRPTSSCACSRGARSTWESSLWNELLHLC